MKNVVLLSIISAWLVGCSASTVGPEPTPAQKQAPLTATTEMAPAGDAKGGKKPAVAEASAKPVTTSEPPPGGFKGLPWRACPGGINGNAYCTNALFRTTPLGLMTDGTGGAAPSGACTTCIYNTTGCQNGFCRAELANSHQCKNGDTVKCEAWTHSGGSGGAGFGGGTSTCQNGAWSSCAN